MACRRGDAVVQEGKERGDHQCVKEIAVKVEGPDSQPLWGPQQICVAQVAEDREDGEDVRQLLAAEPAGQQSKDGCRQQSYQHVACLGQQFRLSRGCLPAQEIESALIVEFDKESLFQGLEDPEAGDDQKEIKCHQKSPRPLLPANVHDLSQEVLMAQLLTLATSRTP